MTQMSIIQTIETMIASFQRDADHEQWKTAHDQAMACYDLQDLIDLGLQCHAFIERIEKTWSARVDDGSLQYDIKDVKLIQSLYRQWLAPCDHMLAVIKDFESRGFTVRNAPEFRDAVGFCSLPQIDIEESQRTFDRFERGEGVVVKEF